jgi:hypothetical protein
MKSKLPACCFVRIAGDDGLVGAEAQRVFLTSPLAAD